MPMHAQERGDRLAVTGLPTRGQRQGMQPLPLLAVGFTLHAALQRVGAFVNRWYCFAHTNAPPFG
jgi:hypothetical protein